MRNLTYRPLVTGDVFGRDIDQLFGQLRNLLGTDADEGTTVATSAWVPAVDIKEEADRFVIHADIPGVDPENIEVTLEQGMLSIKGERTALDQEDRKDYRRVERVRGVFYRRFSLPDTADVEHVSATGKNGVLEIIIPKQPVALPRKIEVVH